MYKLKSKVSKRFLFAVFGIAGLISGTVVLYLTFLVAFMNGGVVTITINSVGEAWPEFFLLPVMLISGVYGFFYLFRQPHDKELVA